VSGYAMEWAHELAADKRLTVTVGRVLVGLAYHAHRKTGKAWPAVDTLAAEVNLDRRTVQRALAVIERRTDPETGETAGYVDTIRRTGYATVWLFPQSPQNPHSQFGGGGAHAQGGGAHDVGGRHTAALTSKNKVEQGGALRDSDKPDPDPSGCPQCLGTGWRTGPGGQSVSCSC